MSRSRFSHQAFAAVLVIVLGLAYMVGIEAQPAAAGPTLVRTFDHNVKLNRTGAINFISANDPPLIITAQEVCRSQYDSLKSALQSRGYTVWGLATVSSSFPCSEIGGGPDGGIIMTASLGSSPGPPLRGYYSAQAPGDTTRRGYVCKDSSFIFLSWWACSTHITPNSASYAVQQSTSMRNIAFFINDRAVVVGGDFNRKPWQSGPADWANGFAEADSTNNSFTYKNPPYGATYKKIDYIFSMRLRTDAGFGVARVGCGAMQTSSDHCFIHGYMRFL